MPNMWDPTALVNYHGHIIPNSPSNYIAGSTNAPRGSQVPPLFSQTWTQDGACWQAKDSWGCLPSGG